MNCKKQRRLIGLIGVVTLFVTIILIGNSDLAVVNSESSWMTWLVRILFCVWTVSCLIVIIAMLCDYENIRGLHECVFLLVISIIASMVLLPEKQAASSLATGTGWDYVAAISMIIWWITHYWIVIWDGKYIKNI